MRITAFITEKHSRLHLFAAASKLLFRNALFLHFFHNPIDRLVRLRFLFGIYACVNDLQTAIGVRRKIGIHRICKSAFFTNLLEKPCAHRAAKYAVDRVDDIFRLISASHGRVCDRNMHLFDRFLFDQTFSIRDKLWRTRFEFARIQISEIFLHERLRRLRVDTAGKRYNDIFGTIPRLFIPLDIRHGKTLYVFSRTENISAVVFFSEKRA